MCKIISQKKRRQTQEQTQTQTKNQKTSQNSDQNPKNPKIQNSTHRKIKDQKLLH